MLLNVLQQRSSASELLPLAGLGISQRERKIIHEKYKHRDAADFPMGIFSDVTYKVNISLYLFALQTAQVVDLDIVDGK